MTLLLLRRLLTCLAAAAAVLSPPLVCAAALTPGRLPSEDWQWPLSPTPAVERPYEPPASTWSRGHRGVDLLGRQGQPVSAIGAGTIAFAGPLAGRGVVVVRHGDLRSTYEPVTASLPVGTVVSAGQVIGLLQSVRSHCLPLVCLHLGVRHGNEYVDPLSLLGARPVRLKPVTGSSEPSRSPALTAPEPSSPQTRPSSRPRPPSPSASRGSSAAWPVGSAAGLGLALSALTMGGISYAARRRYQARG